jgi:hypothetical protein
MHFLLGDVTANMDWVPNLNMKELPGPGPSYTLTPGEALYMIGNSEALEYWLSSSSRNYDRVHGSRFHYSHLQHNIETSDTTQLSFVARSFTMKGAKHEAKLAANLAKLTAKARVSGFLTGVNQWHHNHSSELFAIQVYNANHATSLPQGAVGLQQDKISYEALGVQVLKNMTGMQNPPTPQQPKSYVVTAPSLSNPFRKKYHKIRGHVNY